MNGAEAYLEHGWGWDRYSWVPLLKGTTPEKIRIGWRMVNGSKHGKATQISMSHSTTETRAKDLKFCATKRWDCWCNATLVKAVFVVCLWDHHNVGLTFKFKIHIIETKRTTSAPVKEDEKIQSPQIFEIGPCDQKCRSATNVV